MNVFSLTVSPYRGKRVEEARPSLQEFPGGSFWAFCHGERGRGKQEVLLPLSIKSFPASAEPTPPYKLIYTPRGTPLLIRGEQEGSIALLDLCPGYGGEARYRIEGDAQVLLEGFYAYGVAGRLEGTPYPVIWAKGSCRIAWVRTGRLSGDYPYWIAEWDGATWMVKQLDQGLLIEEALLSDPHNTTTLNPSIQSGTWF